jgi:subtilisin-like proprotein convertase family protein
LAPARARSTRPALAAPGTFDNTEPISVPATGTSGAAGPYPATIAVSGEVGLIAKVTVTLSDITRGFLADLNVLLVAPSGQSVVLLSDAGLTPPDEPGVANVTLTFDDAAAVPSSDVAQITSGTYRPTDVALGDPDVFPSPAPAPPRGAGLSAFDGQDPNGTRSLYVVDQYAGDSGTIAGGWSQTITTAAPTAAPTSSETPTATNTPTANATATDTPSATATATPTATATDSATATSTATATATGTSAPTATPTTAPSLSVSPTRVVQGDTVTAAWSGILGPTATDWVGLYAPGAADGDYLAARCATGPSRGSGTGAGSPSTSR